MWQIPVVFVSLTVSLTILQEQSSLVFDSKYKFEIIKERGAIGVAKLPKVS